jgi:alkylated DNA repair dioxygenase AlkB
MNPIVPRFKDLGIFGHTPHQQPNHVLINEYKPGEGIMPHEDGKAYASVVATVSLGGTVCLSLTQKLGSKEEDSEVKHVEGTWKVPTRILQEPRSLLITTGDAYESLLHDRTQYEKADGRNVRTTRVSLTYRDVLKVSSAASKVFGGLGRR